MKKTIVILTCCLWGKLFAAQSSPDTAGYHTPAPDLAAVVETKFPPAVSIDPTNRWLLQQEFSWLPSLAEISRPEVKLAGLCVNPRTHAENITLYYCRFTLKSLSGKSTKEINGPDSLKASFVKWSGDGEYFAFCNNTGQGLELWVAETATGKVRKLLEPVLSAALGDPYVWMPDNRSLLVRLRVGDEKTIPQKPEVPGGPIIQENTGPAKPARTFPDLIKSRYDEELFAYYAISQIARLSLGGELRKIGQPDLYTEASISPNGRFLLVTAIRRPFSYQFTYDRFPQSIQIWNIDGEAVKQVYEQPLLDQIPIARGAVQAGPRYFFWRADQPASLCWVEAQDGGDPKNQLPIRDVLIQLGRPFTAAPETLARMAWRYGGTLWGNDTLAIHLEYWPVTKRGRAWLADPSGRKTNRLMYDLSYEDVYADPGDPVMVPGPDGYNKLLLAPDGGSLYLIGRGASEEGNRPFIDRLDLNTLKTTRLWRSEKPYYSRPARLLDDKASRVIIRRESPEEPSNYFVMKLPGKKLTRLTEFKNTQPQFTGIQKKIIRYKRDDGINLSATLYLPKGYKPGKGGRLPLMMWAYPQDYQNAAAAGQVEDTPYRFTWITPWSPVVWLLRGFAVMDDPSMPVVAKEGQESNDTFVEQLVSSARAAIQEAVRLGVADSSRVAVGGHSYGAFMAANLVTHSNLFRAGIAQSGAYNRTLTPFGFQYEDRDLWKAREVYINTSPFLSADSIHAPLLLVHGQADDNPGTYTMQSERYFEALKGLGKNSRLVLFPSEKHGYRARETWLHLLWEIDRWLKLYVIPAKTRDK